MIETIDSAMPETITGEVTASNAIKAPAIPVNETGNPTDHRATDPDATARENARRSTEDAAAIGAGMAVQGTLSRPLDGADPDITLTSPAIGHPEATVRTLQPANGSEATSVLAAAHPRPERNDADLGRVEASGTKQPIDSEEDSSKTAAEPEALGIRSEPMAGHAPNTSKRSERHDDPFITDRIDAPAPTGLLPVGYTRSDSPASGATDAVPVDLGGGSAAGIQNAAVGYSGIAPLPAAGPWIVETADAPASTLTPYFLPVGFTGQGNIASSNDFDWYRTNLIQGQTYSFSAIGTGTNGIKDPFMALHDASGAILVGDGDSGPHLGATITYTASQSGYYYLDVESQGYSSIGQYGISATLGTRPSFDIPMGAGALDSYSQWTALRGTGAIVTFGFRQTAATYTSSSNIGTFTQCTAAEMTAVRSILKMYSDVCGIQFTDVNPGGYTDNATILIGNYSDPNDGFGAFATPPGLTIASAQAGDVWLNTAGSVQPNSLPLGSYSYQTIIHELGHALGLLHPGDYNASPGVTITYANSAQFLQDSYQYTVMSYFAGSATGEITGATDLPYTPLLFDIYELQQIYGTNFTTRAANTTYGFSSGEGATYTFTAGVIPALCIWDGGGTDILDCSGFSQAQNIDLNQGALSNIGGGIGNVSIALGAIIENATGGSGADTVLGNASANTLSGGLGTNTMTGGAGSDTFIVTGTDTINDLGNDGVGEVLTVKTSGSVTATLAGAWTATPGTENLGTAIVMANGFNANVAAATTSVTGDHGFTLNNAGNATAVTLTGSSLSDTLIGGSGADTLIGGLGSNTLTGGAGIDTFTVTSTDTITDLANGGVGEVVTLAAGSSVTANLAAAWTATSGTQNLGTATIMANGFNANVAAATTSVAGDHGFTLNNTGGANAVTLTGSALADTIIGGQTGDILVGGSGIDTFQVTSGTEYLADLANGGTGEILGVAAGATANAYLAADWNATAASLNLGTAGIYANGHNVNMSLANTSASGAQGYGIWDSSSSGTTTNAVTLVGSGGADGLYASHALDSLTGGGGRDWFEIASALGISGTTATSPVKITDFAVGTAGDHVYAETVYAAGHTLHADTNNIGAGWTLNNGFATMASSTVASFFTMCKSLTFTADTAIGYSDGTNAWLYLMTEGSQANSSFVELLGVNATMMSAIAAANTIHIG